MLIPLDEVCHFDVTTHEPATGAISDADSAPTFDVFEEATDTPILDDQTMTKRTSLTGNYRGTFTASAANGFEAGKWYSVVVSATVDAVAAKHVAMHFRVAPTESAAGVPKADVSHWLGTAAATPTVAGVPEVDVTHWLGTAAATPTVAGVPEVDVTHFGGSAGTFASGRPEANASHIGGSAISQSGGFANVNVEKWNTTDVPAEHTAGYPIVTVKDGTGTGEINTDAGKIVEVSTLTGHTPQTGDAFARLGAPAGASVSADIAAIEAQTDDIGTAGAGLTSIPWNAAWDAEVQSEVQDAIEANHLDHLLAADYDPQNKPGHAGALLNEMVESDNASPNRARFTAGALEEAPTGGSAPTVGQIADAVWDEATAGHTTGGTFGEQVKTDIDDILADTAVIGTPSNLGGGATVAANLSDIEGQTDDIGAAGAGLTAIPDSAGVTTLLSRIPAALFSGITSLAQWLGLIAGKQTGNSTARTEVRATGAGSGTFDETTDSQEAIRDRGDSAWTTATGFSTHSAADVWAVGTRTLTSFGTLVADVATAVWGAATRLLTAGTNIVLAKGVGVTGFNDLSAAEVNTEADTALADAGVTSARQAKLDGLPEGLKKNQALADFEFFMVDAADHVTGKTGLTITAQRSIDGGAFAACTNAATELGNGVYVIDLSAADLNGTVITFRFTGTGADATVLTVKTSL